MDVEIDPRLRESPGDAYLQRAIGTTPIPANATRFSGPPQQHYQPSLQDSPNPSNYQPNTPQSVGNGADTNSLNETNAAPDGTPNDAKRPRACEACRGLKVRCAPDPNNPEGPCKRCAKANRNCIFTVPSRKRQKKTDSRVAELEKKIDALTASLQATQPPPVQLEKVPEQEAVVVESRHRPYEQVTNGNYGSPVLPRTENRASSSDWSQHKTNEFDATKVTTPPVVMAGQKRKQIDTRDYNSAPDARPSHTFKSTNIKRPAEHSAAPRVIFRPPAVEPLPPPRPAPTHEYADVVDRGVITADIATKMFNHYVDKLAPQMPAVVFPAGTTAADVRKTKPILFLAILSASSGSNYPELQRSLTKEVMGIYADRIICSGEKTLELVQALQINTLWYWPPEHFEEIKFYQLIHIAAVMAIDIGMGKRSKAKQPRIAGLWRDHPWRRTPYPDSESIEARRAWLACYFLCCNASMGLRRPNLIRWTGFMAECVHLLETSPEAAPSDRTLCQWVRSQHIAEEVGTQFSMDDPVANISIGDPKIQYALKGFERDLEKWSSQIPADVQSPALKMTEHVVSLYMHEVAMHVDHNADDFKAPFSEDALRISGNQDYNTLTPAHIGALSTCLSSIDGIFETFVKFDIEVIRCIPTTQFVRVAYAVVVLIKMYFAAAIPNSELGKVINKDDMKVEQYLDDLVEIFRASSAEEKSRPAAKFLMVLIMLKTWFHRHWDGKQQGATDGDASTPFTNPGSKIDPESLTGTPSISRQSIPKLDERHTYSPANINTPLQLLSEVATGNQGGPRSDGANVFSSPSDWRQQAASHPSQQPPQQPNQQPPQQPPHQTPHQPSQSYPSYGPPMNHIQPPIQPGYGVVGMGTNIDPSLGVNLQYAMGDGFEQAIGMTLGGAEFGTYFGDDAFFGSLMDSAAGTGGSNGNPNANGARNVYEGY